MRKTFLRQGSMVSSTSQLVDSIFLTQNHYYREDFPTFSRHEEDLSSILYIERYYKIHD